MLTNPYHPRMRFQECFNQLPSNEKSIILRLFRDWTRQDAERGGIKINQFAWEHFLSSDDLREILKWMAWNLGALDSFDQALGALKSYLRQHHQIKGGAIQSAPHPRLIGTTSPLRRFVHYLEQNHASRFEDTYDIETFIHTEKLWKPIRSSKVAHIPFRNTGIAWFFWDEPGYPSLLSGDVKKSKKSDFVHALGLDATRFATDKMLLFVFDFEELLNRGLTLHRPTFGDAACYMQFLPPPYRETRFGLTIPFSTPANAWIKNAGPAGGDYPERLAPEGVLRTDDLLLKHIVHYQILD